jgi:hypothetical protein
MPTVNEWKYLRLHVAAGKPDPSTLNELALHVLGTKLGDFTGTLNERWFKEFLLNGGASTKAALPWNTNAYLYLINAGCTPASLSEMWFQFWKDDLFV